MCVLYFYTALNQLAGTGWLMGDGLKNFISRLLMLIMYLNSGGLAPLGCHWHCSFVSPKESFRQDKRTSII